MKNLSEVKYIIPKYKGVAEMLRSGAEALHNSTGVIARENARVHEYISDELQQAAEVIRKGEGDISLLPSPEQRKDSIDK